ncbi:recombinase family protein [Streptomyces nodosus]|uniref:recombinase family protein n=1 Tax=Streptomyces nodosus TaxID=40318 RepID=UPI00382CF120
MLPRQRPPADDDNLTPYIGYVRVSTWKEEKISPELQRESILRWARDVGARIVRWVEDLDESGRHFKRKITGCVEAVEGGEARGVAVWRYSRFGRDRTGNALWLARLEKAGGQLESATERIDATTAVGRFQRGMILEFGAFESDRAGEQWRETHEHRKYKLGLPAQGRKRSGYIWHRRRVPDPASPEGYRIQKERYEIEAEYGPVIADLYRQYSAGDGFTALCSRLNRAGWRTTQGAMWRTETLRRYMDGGFPAGLLTVHDPECRCGKTDGSCQTHVHIQGAHDELIDWDLWEAYLRRRKQVRETAPRSRVGLYQLTGLVKHAQCRGGTSLTTKREGGRTKNGYAYRCSLRAHSGGTACEGVYVRRDIVEDEVRDWLAREAAAGIDAAPSAPIEDMRDRAAREQADNARARVRAQAEVDKQRQALARLRADYAANPDDYGPGEYEDAVAEIRAKRQKAEQILAELPAEAETLPDRAKYVPLILGVIDVWDAMETAEQNGILRQLLRRVALVRHGAGSAGCEIQIHPVWEPDPWQPNPGEGTLVPNDDVRREAQRVQHDAGRTPDDQPDTPAREGRARPVEGDDLDRAGTAPPVLF